MTNPASSIPKSEPTAADINGVAQALARAIADSRVLRMGVCRCPHCGRSFGGTGRGEAKLDPRRALRLHLLNVTDCRKLMLKDGTVPPDSRRSEPVAIPPPKAGPGRRTAEMREDAD